MFLFICILFKNRLAIHSNLIDVQCANLKQIIGRLLFKISMKLEYKKWERKEKDGQSFLVMNIFQLTTLYPS